MALEPLYPVFIVLAILAVLHWVIGLWLMFRWQNVFPIAGRKRTFVVIQSVALMSWSGFDLVGGIVGETPCAARLVCIHFALYTLVTSYLTRFCRLQFEYFASCEKIQLRASAYTVLNVNLEPNADEHDASSVQMRDAKSDSMWFSDRRHYVKTRNLIKFFVILVSLEMAASATSFAIESQRSDFEAVSDLCPSLRTSLFIFSAFAGISCCLGLHTAWKLRGIEDGFGIKNELKWSACVGIYNIVVANVLSRVLDFDSDVYRVLLWLGNQAFMFYLVSRPVLQAYRHQRFLQRKIAKRLNIGDNHSTASIELSLNMVLDDMDYREQFIEHLKREFAVENILFYEDAKKFSEQCRNNGFESSAARTRRAMELYTQYLAEDAPLEVNLSNIIRAKIITALGCEESTFEPADLALENAIEVPPDIFDEARNAIYRLMHQDSFVRFKQEHIKFHRATMYKLATIKHNDEKSRTLTRVSKPRDEELSLYENVTRVGAFVPPVRPNTSRSVPHEPSRST